MGNSQSSKIAVYAGSFDPITLGHMEVIKAGIHLFDKLFIVIGYNPSKEYNNMFSYSERSEMIRVAVDRELGAETSKKITISVWGGIIVKFAQEQGAGWVLRGVRNASDFEAEQTLCRINKDIQPDIETILVIPPRNLSEVSSSFVKGLMAYDGWEKIVKQYVPRNVLKQMIKRQNYGIESFSR